MHQQIYPIEKAVYVIEKKKYKRFQVSKMSSANTMNTPLGMPTRYVFPLKRLCNMHIVKRDIKEQMTDCFDNKITHCCIILLLDFSYKNEKN